MKKLTILIAAIALVCFAVPALAVDWNFYGSARINTWYVSQDFGDGLNAAKTDDKDAGVRWGQNGQTNSRLGARVKAENVSGRLEIQLKGNASGDPGGDITTESRLIYGVWDFGAGKMKVGKDYTPTAQFISGQVFDEDLGLLGIGTMYGNRVAGLTFSFGGFDIALLDPVQKDISMVSLCTVIPPVTVSDLVQTPTGGDVDSYIPKIEAHWGMSYDAWNFNLMGGFQTYEIEDVTSTVDGSTNDIDVTSYTIGGDVGFNFGPGYVKGGASFSRNAANAAWHLPGVRNNALGSSAVWDGDDDTDDADTIMFALVGGMKMSDMLSFEGGFGWRQDDSDVSGAEKDKAWEAYVQSVIVMAPGVYIVPEIGYTNFMDNLLDNDEGDQFYLGAKWQIDF